VKKARGATLGTVRKPILPARARRHAQRIRYDLDRGMIGMQQYFASVLEVHRHAIAGNALHLTDTPLGTLQEPDILTRLQQRVHARILRVPKGRVI